MLKQLDKNLEEYHISKRYDLYPRCQKHRDCPINVCNSCIVSLLNLESCPYGCEYDKKTRKPAKASNTKVSETGFVSLYPKVSVNDEEYLEFFVFKHIEEAGRLDKWETNIRKIRKAESAKASVLSKFTLYASACQTGPMHYLYCGGAAGNNIGGLKTVADAFWVHISEDRKLFLV